MVHIFRFSGLGLFLRSLVFTLLIISSFHTQAQDTTLVVDYTKVKEYTIANIKVVGTQNDKTILISLSGLRQGQKIKIPGEELSKAIKTLWKQRLFTNVTINVDKVVGDQVFLAIVVEERPRMKTWPNIVGPGIKSSDKEDLKKKMDLRPGDILTDNKKLKALQIIRNYYIDKGFFNVKVEAKVTKDSMQKNVMNVTFFVLKGEPVRIRDIQFQGVTAFSEPMLRHRMKETKEKVKFETDSIFQFRRNFKKFGYHPKWYEVPGSLSPYSWYQYLEHFVNLNIFKASKFRKKEYEEDKKSIIEFYNSKGYRDARITWDSTYPEDKANMVVIIRIDEGKKYYFRNLSKHCN